MDYAKAKDAFEKFVSNYDKTNNKIARKIEHTHEVVKLSEALARFLKLSDEDIYLAKIIALLHDIGRFDQVNFFDSFDDDMTIDHADHGNKLLFSDGLIRDFVDDYRFDEIIKSAIKNHNKYAIEDDLSDRQLLHSQIIRDTDKIDIYRVIYEHGFLSENVFGPNDVISDESFADFMNGKLLNHQKKKTKIDNQLSYLAFIFDINFDISLKYIREKDYINKILGRFAYENPDTAHKMKIVQKHANDYLAQKLLGRT